ALPLILDGLAQRGIQVVGPEEAAGMRRDELMPPAPRAPLATLVAGADTVVFGFLGGIARLVGPAFGFALALLGLRAAILAVCAPVQARRARRRQPPPFGGTVSVVVPAYNEETLSARRGRGGQRQGGQPGEPAHPLAGARIRHGAEPGAPRLGPGRRRPRGAGRGGRLAAGGGARRGRVP